MRKIDEKEILRRLELLSQVKPTSEATDRAMERARKTLANNEKRKESLNVITWRTIMKSRITKLAAAAVVVIALIGLWPEGGVTSKVYGMSDVVQLIKQAKTLHIQGWFFRATDEGAKVAEAIREREGYDEPPPSDQGNTRLPLPFDYWYDVENGRYRLEEPTHFTTVFDGEYIMKEDPRKSISYVKLSDYQGRLAMQKQLRSPFLGNLRPGSLEQIQGSMHIGREEIDGIHYDVWEIEFNTPHPTEEQHCRIRSWLCPLTGELGCVKVWEKQGLNEWYQIIEVEKFERDVVLPPDIFQTEPSDGCTLENTKEAAPVMQLGGTGLSPLDETQYRLLLKIHIGFTLSDGSVIVCWRSRLASEPSQAEYFQGLEMGGDLPNLPLVIDALIPMPEIEGLQYVGYHLAYTKKGDRYYEWSLYVPDKDAPPRSALIGYQCHQEYSTDIRAEYNNTAIYDDLTIETEEEFDTWVLGAMAELSDDGLVPRNVTYENIMGLAKELNN